MSKPRHSLGDRVGAPEDRRSGAIHTKSGLLVRRHLEQTQLSVYASRLPWSGIRRNDVTGNLIGRINLLFLCAASFIAPAHAQSIVDTPILVPANPVAGQQIYVEVHPTPCVLYFNDTPPLVTRDGNAITMFQEAYVSPDPDFCIYPSGSLDLPLGSFAAGSYTVQVDVHYETLLNGPVTQTLGILPLIVSAPEAIPLLSIWSAAVLIVLLLLLGVRTHRGITECCSR